MKSAAGRMNSFLDSRNRVRRKSPRRVWMHSLWERRLLKIAIIIILVSKKFFIFYENTFSTDLFLLLVLVLELLLATSVLDIPG